MKAQATVEGAIAELGTERMLQWGQREARPQECAIASPVPLIFVVIIDAAEASCHFITQIDEQMQGTRMMECISTSSWPLSTARIMFRDPSGPRHLAAHAIDIDRCGDSWTAVSQGKAGIVGVGVASGVAVGVG